MLVTLPVVLPIVMNAGYDLLWFGIMLAKVLEVGMLTPPIGLNVFVIKGVVGDRVSLGTIFRGVTWFVIADLIVIGLMMLLPEIVLYAPSLIGTRLMQVSNERVADGEREIRGGGACCRVCGSDREAMQPEGGRVQ